MIRTIVNAFNPLPTQDGAGVKIKRVFPIAEIDNIDPFLLLDHFGSKNSSDFIAGFPMHPHRGIETVTYMLEGSLSHSDSTGRKGTIATGGVQWMSAGRGIMHEEMPHENNGSLNGFQLWVNLPASEKMKKPQYQEYDAKEITKFTHDGNEIVLISGSLLGKEGAIKEVSTLPLYADISLNDGILELDLPKAHHAFFYLFEGETSVLSEDGSMQSVQAPKLVVLSEGESLSFSTPTHARLMLAAAQKINEPIERWGPFVMNTKEEIKQTLAEVHSRTFPPK
ncbi:MAG: pirin family protein [Sulfurovum sp.]|nr:pirin family protein [Sulfurovum sp.]